MKLQLIISAICCTLLLGCQQQVEETKPIRKDITETVFASGELESEGTYNLTAQSDGYLLELDFEEGDLVEKDDVLAVIDNENSLINTQNTRDLYQIAARNTRNDAPALSQARASIDIAREKMEQDSLQAARYEKLM